MSLYPRLVALDLDGTVYNGWLNEYAFGKGWGASGIIQDNLELADGGWSIQDRSNPNQRVRLYNDVPDIITDIVRNGAQLAIVSRNTNKNLTDRAMWLWNTNDPRNGWRRSLTDFVNYDEVYDQSKIVHFQRIQGWSGISYSDMIIFDDEPHNNEVETKLGVTFKPVIPGIGLNWKSYNDGIAEWRRNQYIRVPFIGKNPQLYQKPLFLGYVGTDFPNSIEYQNGRRRLDARASRWGYGMYVTDNVAVALFFSDWNKKDAIKDGKRSDMYICEVYARDRDVFIQQLGKVWFPQHDQYLTKNWEGWSEDRIASKQIERDTIVENHGVQKPYILFAKHDQMDGMEVPGNGQVNEMVVYPQVQDALMFGDPKPADHWRSTVDQFYARGQQWHEAGGFDRKASEWGVKWINV